MNRKNIPFEFVFDHLLPIEVTVKPMFGMFAVYGGEKILLILRDRKNHPGTNGVWIATGHEYYKSLKKDLPSMCSIATYSNDNFVTGWQMIPAEAKDFEMAVTRICEFIVRRDPRIGKIPQPRQNKKNR